MQDKVNDMLTHISDSHHQMARIIDSQRHVAVRMSKIVHDLPDCDPDLGSVNGIMENAGYINKSIICYLNSIADFEETIAEILTLVMKEICHHEEE